MPRRAAVDPALPDGAPSVVASRASDGSLAVFGRDHNTRWRTKINRSELRISRAPFPPVVGIACRGTDKAPADRGGLRRVWADDDLRRPSRAFIAGQEHAD